MRFGTIYNTLLRACEVSGEVVAEPPVARELGTEEHVSEGAQWAP